MRIGTVSALCTSLALICLPRPAAAQFIPASPQRPQASFRKLPSPASLSESLSGAESRGGRSIASLINAPADVPWSLRNWAHQQEEAGAMGVPSPAETGRCAHILIYRAPIMDSKIIIKAPDASDMPKLEGLQACSEDFRGVVAIPQLGPFVGPGRIGLLDRKLEMQIYPLRPQSSTRERLSGRIP
jgi:hypothetical protein